VFTNVPGVPAAPLSAGLVASAVRPDIPRWESGLAWIPERCASTYHLVPWCDVPTVSYDHPRPGAAYHRPVGLRIADECSTLNGPVDYDRVKRVAEAQTPFAVARELWDGAMTTADPYPLPLTGGSNTNAHLDSADATIVGTGGATPLIGLGALEQAALEASHGQQVFIHVPPLLLPQFADSGYLRPVGDMLVTLAGNVVVADAGYPGTGPAAQAVGATAWIYATSPVAVLMTPLDVEENDAWNVDRDVNTRTVWATRLFAATFDPCVHLASEITI